MVIFAFRGMELSLIKVVVLRQNCILAPSFLIYFRGATYIPKMFGFFFLFRFLHITLNLANIGGFITFKFLNVR